MTGGKSASWSGSLAVAQREEPAGAFPGHGITGGRSLLARMTHRGVLAIFLLGLQTGAPVLPQARPRVTGGMLARGLGKEVTCHLFLREKLHGRHECHYLRRRGAERYRGYGIIHGSGEGPGEGELP